MAQTRAEAYGKVPAEDMLKVAAYKKECAEATDKGIPLSDSPGSLSGLGQAFFTDMDCITQDSPFSRAANLLYRREVYAAQASTRVCSAEPWVQPVEKSTRLLYRSPGSLTLPRKSSRPRASAHDDDDDDDVTVS